MKRYDLDGYDAGMLEYEGGDYVKYEDAARILAQRDRLAELLRKTMEMTTWYTANPDVVRHANDCMDALAELDKEKQS